MRIETPERYMKVSDEDRQLDMIEDYITCLTEELEEAKTQLNQKKKWGKRQQLRETIEHLELQLKLARREEKHLMEKIWGVKY